MMKKVIFMGVMVLTIGLSLLAQPAFARGIAIGDDGSNCEGYIINTIHGPVWVGICK